MPTLLQSLQARDLGHLRIVAGLWGMELASSENEAALKNLTAALLDPDLVHEIVDSLSAQAQSALETLTEAGGKIPWAAFARQFGEIREIGPGRRDREQVYLNPVSIAETLFYRAFLARAFFDTPNGAQEFAYIPEDLAEIIKHEGHKGSQGKTSVSQSSEPLGRLATPREYTHPSLATDRLLDDATTFLAALRMGLRPPEMKVPVGIVKELLQAAGIVEGEVSRPEQVKSFLEMSRMQALNLLKKAWRASNTFNELRMVPGLVCEGEWTNQPGATRTFLFHLLEALPEGKWWSLPAFIRAIKDKYPDFQRPAGDYDSWFIKRLSDGAYLRGFTSWDEVDGALVHYLITGPMFWLGTVELAMPEEDKIVTAFRVNKKRVTSDEKGKLTVSSNGRISVPRLVPRVTRYLIARFCEWEEDKPDGYRYHVTTASLKKAREQGLKVGQLLSLLARNATSEIPPAFVKALKRWELNGTEARVEVQAILRVTRPEILDELRKTKARRFLGESLGPVTIIVKPAAQAKVLAALAEMGLLAEVSTDSQSDINGCHP
ncbi:MAG: helicase-associated domain-containing protein [Anaerolineales bacterium]